VGGFIVEDARRRHRVLRGGRRDGGAGLRRRPVRRPARAGAASSWRRRTTRWGRCPCTRWCRASTARPVACASRARYRPAQ
jgi:hypothetical protein